MFDSWEIKYSKNKSVNNWVNNINKVGRFFEGDEIFGYCYCVRSVRVYKFIIFFCNINDSCK